MSTSKLQQVAQKLISIVCTGITLLWVCNVAGRVVGFASGVIATATEMKQRMYLDFTINLWALIQPHKVKRKGLPSMQILGVAHDDNYVKCLHIVKNKQSPFLLQHFSLILLYY